MMVGQLVWVPYDVANCEGRSGGGGGGFSFSFREWFLEGAAVLSLPYGDEMSPRVRRRVAEGGYTSNKKMTNHFMSKSNRQYGEP